MRSSSPSPPLVRRGHRFGRHALLAPARVQLHRRRRGDVQYGGCMTRLWAVVGADAEWWRWWWRWRPSSQGDWDEEGDGGVADAHRCGCEQCASLFRRGSSTAGGPRALGTSALSSSVSLWSRIGRILVLSLGFCYIEVLFWRFRIEVEIITPLSGEGLNGYEVGHGARSPGDSRSP